MNSWDAIVVVPARDEAARIGGCLRALGAQTVANDRFAVVVVLDRCGDDTERIAAHAASECGLDLEFLAGPGRGTGPARRIGMDFACEALTRAGRPEGLIATTDADTTPEPRWLENQLAHVARGAVVVAGRIELDQREASELPAGVLARREQDARRRMRQTRRVDATAAHHHFAGASLGITATTYRAVGGIEAHRDLEDERFAERLREHAVPILRAADVVAITSARTDGRASRGLSIDLALNRWLDQRRYRAEDFSISSLARTRARIGVSVSVVVPAKQCADTIGAVLQQTVGPALAAGLVDRVLVVDAASADGTASVADEVAGVEVIQQDHVRPELGPAQGKGDAMWRALQVCGGDVIAFLDADTAGPAPEHLAGLLGPLLSREEITMVRGCFDRPFAAGAGLLAHEGGRVTELMARPLLNLHQPLLAGFGQPLAGEFAARRCLLERLPFPVGYGVEIASLIDAVRLCGLDAVAECHLGVRQNRHQSLRALGEMAYAVLVAAERRRPGAQWSEPSSRFVKPWNSAEDALVDVPIAERPPISSELPTRHSERLGVASA